MLSPKDFPPEVAPRGAALFFETPVLQLLGDNESMVMEVQDGPKRAVLRVTSHFHRTRDQVQAELEFVEYVTARGFAAAAPLRSKKGLLVEALNVDGHDYWIGASELAPGSHVVAFSDDWNERLFNKWGAAIGRLHNLSEKYDAPSKDDRWQWFEEPCFQDGNHSYAQETARIRASLEAQDTGGYGIVHGDFGRMNFLWTGDEVVAIDFDDCHHHHFLYDLAVAVWPLRSHSREAKDRYLGWLLKGYFSERPKVDRVEEILEQLFRLRTLSMFLYHRMLWSHRDLTEDEVAWLSRLEDSIGKPVWFD